MNPSHLLSTNVNESIITVAFLAFGVMLFDLFKSTIFKSSISPIEALRRRIYPEMRSQELFLPSLGTVGDEINAFSETILDITSAYYSRNFGEDCFERMVCEAMSKSKGKSFVNQLTSIAGFTAVSYITNMFKSVRQASLFGYKKLNCLELRKISSKVESMKRTGTLIHWSILLLWMAYIASAKQSPTEIIKINHSEDEKHNGKPNNLSKEDEDTLSDLFNQKEFNSETNTFQQPFETTDLEGEVSQMTKRHIGSLLPTVYLNNKQKKHFSSILKCKTNSCTLGNRKMTNVPPQENAIFEDIIGANRDKKHLGAHMKFLSSKMNQFNDDGISRDKKHIGSYMRLLSSKLKDIDKNYVKQQNGNINSFLRYLTSKNFVRAPGKRFFSSILQDEDVSDDENDDIVNQHIASMLNEDDDDEESYDYDIMKRHIGSLIEKRRYPFFPSMYDDSKNYIERHFLLPASSIGSIDDFSSHVFPTLPDKERRQLSSVLDSQLKDHSLLNDPLISTDSLIREISNEGKKQASSLLKKYNLDENLLKPEAIENLMSLTGGQNIDKKHVGSLFSDTKRHISSLLSGSKRSNGKTLENDLQNSKRHLSSLLDKRHLSPLFQRSASDVEKRHISSLFGDSLNNEEKRHIASLLNNHRSGEMTALSRTKRNVPEEINMPQDSHAPNSNESSRTTQFTDQKYPGINRPPFVNQSPLLRRKRYLGALARNNNFPFRSSRGIPHRNVKPSHSDNFFDDVENFIREELKKESVREHLGVNEDENIPYVTPPEYPLDYPGKLVFMSASNPESVDEPPYNTDYYPLQDVAFFPTPQKRFLGSLARQNWFPRRYRSFVSPQQSTSDGSLGYPRKYSKSTPFFPYGGGFNLHDDYFTGPAFRG